MKRLIDGECAAVPEGSKCQSVYCEEYWHPIYERSAMPINSIGYCELRDAWIFPRVFPRDDVAEGRR